jgi:peptide/nickel transport system substrate-binding protein
MKKLRWQILIVLLAVIAIVVLLLGRQPVIQAVVPEPATGGVYTEGLIGTMGRLNPLFDYRNLPDREVNRLLFSSLIHYDDRGLPQPDLAESWGTSQDGKIYNFTLRSDVFWHDGEPVTSRDVIFTIGAALSSGASLSAELQDFWENIEVKPLNDKNLQFILPEPFSPFLDYLTFGILPAHLLAELPPEELVDAEFNLGPVGSGPYKFVRFLLVEGEIAGVVLDVNEDYYEGRPFIDQIVFRYYPDVQSAFDAYLDGEILGISQISGDVLEEALGDTSLNLYSGRLPQLSLVYLNLDNAEVPFFQDPAVRQALLYALNRQWMINNLMDGQAILADGPIFPGTWAYYDGQAPFPYDPDKSIMLLREAGFTIPAAGGAVRENEAGPLTIELAYPDDPKYADLAAAIQRYWTAVGGEVTLLPVPAGSLIEDHLSTGDYQAALVDLNMSRAPDPDLYPFWHQAQITGGQNYGRWDDRPASEYLEQARITVNIVERARLYRNFQAIFNRELPALPLFYPVYTYAVDEEVQGIRLGPVFDQSDRFAHIADWFLLAKRVLEELVTPSATP